MSAKDPRVREGGRQRGRGGEGGGENSVINVYGDW